MAALRRDAAVFARCLLTQTVFWGITEAGSWVHTEYCYWGRYFDEIILHRVYCGTHYKYTRNGKRHCADGPAGIYTDGSRQRQWWFNDVMRRVGGPQTEWPDGSRMWCYMGEIHRDDGPAVERADGSKEWWTHGHLVSG